METYNCDLCGSDQHEVIWDKTEREKQGILRSVVIRDNSGNIVHGRVVMCKRCALVYIRERMSKAELDKFYEEEYRETYHEIEGANIHSEKSHAQNAFEIIRSDIKIRIDSILDIGCSSGQLLDLFTPISGYAYVKKEGVEKSQFKTGKHRVYSDISEVKNTYDIVTMLNTLEHVYSPTETLQSVYNLLNDNGYLLVSVPDIYNTNIKRPVDSYLSNAHLYTFSPHTIGMMFNKCGFTVEGIYSIPEEIGDKLYVLARKTEPIEIEWDMHADTKSMKVFLQYVDAVFIGQHMFKLGGCRIEHKNNS